MKRVVSMLILLMLVSVTAYAAPGAPAGGTFPHPVRLVEANEYEGRYRYEATTITPSENGEPLFLGYGSGQSPLSVCGTLWENVLGERPGRTS